MLGMSDSQEASMQGRGMDGTGGQGAVGEDCREGGGGRSYRM